jgi:hypothetical protein
MQNQPTASEDASTPPSPATATGGVLATHTVADSSSGNNPRLVNGQLLHSIISDVHATNIRNGTVARKYRGDILTKARIAGRMQVRNQVNTYDVMCAHDSKRRVLARYGGAVKMVTQTILHPAPTAAELVSSAGRYGAGVGEWTRYDLSAVVERLAKGWAASTVFPDVSATDLAAGAELKYIALNTLIMPASANEGHVYIPTSTEILPGIVLSVFVAAVCGEGGTVVSDVVGLDVTNGRPIIPDVSGEQFMQACAYALRLLGSVYRSSGALDVFGYAVTRGIHAVLSVVGHSDEGGIVRDLLRANKFRTPYGGIVPRSHNYVGLPTPGYTTQSHTAIVDSIALATAAAVAHAAPLVEIKGRSYPVVLATAQGEGADMSMANARSLSTHAEHFSAAYTRAIGLLFGAVDHSGIAATHLAAAFTSPMIETSRHLAYPSVVPFYWVEPTCILPRNLLHSGAEASGYAALVDPDSGQLQMPMFEDATPVPTRQHRMSMVSTPWVSARKSGLIMHLNGHNLNGLGLAVVRGGSVNGWGLCRIPTGAADVLQHMDGNGSVARLLWIRGQSSICHPGECLYLGSEPVKLLFVNRTSPLGWIDEVANLPLAEDLGGMVEVQVTSLHGIPGGRAGAVDNGTARTRTTALNRVVQASNLAATGQYTECPVDADFDVDAFLRLVADARGGPPVAMPNAACTTAADEAALIRAANSTWGDPDARGGTLFEPLALSGSRQLFDDSAPEVSLLVARPLKSAVSARPDPAVHHTHDNGPKLPIRAAGQALTTTASFVGPSPPPEDGGLESKYDDDPEALPQYPTVGPTGELSAHRPSPSRSAAYAAATANVLDSPLLLSSVAPHRPAGLSGGPGLTGGQPAPAPDDDVASSSQPVSQQWLTGPEYDRYVDTARNPLVKHQSWFTDETGEVLFKDSSVVKPYRVSNMMLPKDTTAERAVRIAGLTALAGSKPPPRSVAELEALGLERSYPAWLKKGIFDEGKIRSAMDRLSALASGPRVVLA